jgi:hypothetical protein
MKFQRWIVALFCAGVLAACSSMKPEDFAGQEPRFRVEDYFAGQTRAWGMFEDRFGNLRRQFVVDITGSWDGRVLTLDERFAYSDGEKEQRIWKIAKVDDNTYTGTAGDVVGTAKGRSFGNALNWAYDMNLKVGNDTWRVTFDDWMFLQPDGVLLNRATVTKFGIHIGTVTLSFQKPARQMQVGMRQAAE